MCVPCAHTPGTWTYHTHAPRVDLRPCLETQSGGRGKEGCGLPQGCPQSPCCPFRAKPTCGKLRLHLPGSEGQRSFQALSRWGKWETLRPRSHKYQVCDPQSKTSRGAGWGDGGQEIACPPACGSRPSPVLGREAGTTSWPADT